MTESNATPRRAPSLKRELIVLAAALAVPLVALQMWWGYHDYGMARQHAETDALAFADATSLGVLQFFAQTEELMTATADEFGAEGFTGEACGRHVATMAGLFPFLANALVVGRDGGLICSYVETTDAVSAVAWPWWEGIQSNPVFTIGAPSEADITGGWILPVVAPFTDESGDFAGAVVGALELVRLSSYFGTVNLPETHLITVATADRTVIARSHDAERFVGSPLPDFTGSDRVISRGRSVATGPDLAGVDRTWGQVEVPPGWIIYVGVPDEDVYAPALQEALGHLAATVLVVFLAFLLAGHSYRGIARALGELKQRTRGISEGRPVEVPPGTPSEIADVVERFNETIASREDARRREQTARDRYQSVFDNAVFGLYVSTSDGRFLEVNPALAAMLGYDSPETLAAMGVEALYASRGERERLVHESLTTGEVPTHEMDWLRADGLPITVRLGGKLNRASDGEPVFEMIVQDITEERRTEDELRQTQKMEAIGQLAGGIAHDFNNLLTVIGGNVELLEDDIPDDDPLRQDLTEISRATRRATSLTRRLLTFSSKQRRGGPLEDANEVIAGLRKLLVPLIGENVRLETALAAQSFPIGLDPGELEQVVLNLVLNARDALPRGGTVRITTSSAARLNGGDRNTDGDTIQGDDATAGTGMMLTVSDDGVGMDPEIKPRIFEPFYTTKPMGRGTGLGLSTVYGIVKRADGSVDVETAPGDGTTIRIWLPLAEVDALEQPVTPRVIEGGDETVLVVEDEDQVMTLVRRTLSESGYRVLTAPNGAEALEVLGAGTPSIDLVLTDVVMPHMGGLELAERMSAIAPGVSILFMSGYVDNTFLSKELEQRPELLLRKPFSTAELRVRVRRVLDRAAVAKG